MTAPLWGVAGYSRSITVQASQAGASDSSNFPVLVKLSGIEFKTAANGGHVQNASGYDVLFWSNAGLSSALFWEIDYYDGTNGVLWAWVRVPTVSHSTNTVIYVSYGDASISTFQSTAATVWSNGYDAVYHMSADSSTVRVTDTLGNDNGTNHSTTAGAGQIAGALVAASASSQYVALTDSATLQPTTLTISAWIKSSDATHTQLAFRKANFGYFLRLNSTGGANSSVFDSGGNNVSAGSRAAADGAWHYFVATFDATSSTSNALKTYFDTQAVQQANAVATGNIKYTASSMQIASDGGAPTTTWNGSLDEIHIATGARSADWITTEFNNQSNPTAFAVLGQETILHGTLMALGIGN